MTPGPAQARLVIPAGAPAPAPYSKEPALMSKSRLIAAFAGALLTLAFATSALASGGGSPGDANVIRGGRGDDVLRGGAGDDRLSGGSGNDRLSDDRGSDRMSGGAGDDRINARDARRTHDRRDVVDCGAGDDTALVDSDDVVRHCEHVLRKADDNGVHAPGTDDNGNGNGGADDPAGHA